MKPAVIVLGISALTAASPCRDQLRTATCTDVQEFDRYWDALKDCAITAGLSTEAATEDVRWLSRLCGHDLGSSHPGLVKRGLRRSLESFLSGIGAGFSAAMGLTPQPTQAVPMQDPQTVRIQTTQIAPVTIRPQPATTARQTMREPVPTDSPATSPATTASVRTRTTIVSTTITPTTTQRTTVPPSPQSTVTTSASTLQRSTTSLVAISTPSTATAAPASTSSASSMSKSGKHLSGAAIAAIVIFVLLLLGALAWFALFLYRKKQRERLNEKLEEDLHNDSLLYPEPKLPIVYDNGKGKGVEGAAVAAGIGAGAVRRARNHSGDSDSLSDIRQPPVRHSFEGSGEGAFNYQQSRGVLPDPKPMPVNPARPPPTNWGQQNKNLHHLTYQQQGDGYNQKRNSGQRFPVRPNQPTNNYQPYRPGPGQNNQGPRPGMGGMGAGPRPRPASPQLRIPAHAPMRPQLPPSLVAGSAPASSPLRNVENSPPLSSTPSPQIPQGPKLHVVNRTPTPASQASPKMEDPESPTTPHNTASAHAVSIVTGGAQIVSVSRSNSRATAAASPVERPPSSTSSRTVHTIKRKQVGGT